MSDTYHTISAGPSDDLRTIVDGDVYAWNFTTHPHGPQENTSYDLSGDGWEKIEAGVNLTPGQTENEYE